MSPKLTRLGVLCNKWNTVTFTSYHGVSYMGKFSNRFYVRIICSTNNHLKIHVKPTCIQKISHVSCTFDEHDKTCQKFKNKTHQNIQLSSCPQFNIQTIPGIRHVDVIIMAISINKLSTRYMLFTVWISLQWIHDQIAWKHPGSLASFFRTPFAGKCFETLKAST